VIQTDLLLVENANDAAADFSKLVWVFFNLCQSTEVFELVASFFHRELPPHRNRVGGEYFACHRRTLSTVVFLDGLLPSETILRHMTQEKTERSNCRFTITETKNGKPQIVVERYHQTISVLNNTVLGFDLLGGTTLEQAKKIVSVLNENVLDVFVTMKQNRAIPGS